MTTPDPVLAATTADVRKRCAELEAENRDLRRFAAQVLNGPADGESAAGFAYRMVAAAEALHG